MTQGFTIYGDVTAEQILSALKSLLPDRDINIVPSYRPNKNAHSHSNHSINNNELIITTLSDDKKRVEELESKLNSKQKELIEVEEACNKATLSIQTFHKQQQALFDEFVLLRQRYDEQKTTLLTILWKHCASCHPDLREIPPAEDEETFKETDSEVGNLIVGELLGEGQFATVRVCQRKGEEKSYALKVIKKERITSFTSLLRVSNEIASLKNLKSEYIVSVTDVIQTTSKLYIVTEKGGFDLFEFFDEHPDGVPEKWAKQIMTCIMKGVVYCHSHSVCHRGK